MQLRGVPDADPVAQADGRSWQGRFQLFAEAPSNGYHHVDIRYATGNRLATVSINGSQVFSGLLATAPRIEFGGFQMFRAAEYGGQIDNFEIKDVTAQEVTLVADGFSGDGPLWSSRPT